MAEFLHVLHFLEWKAKDYSIHLNLNYPNLNCIGECLFATDQINVPMGTILQSVLVGRVLSENVCSQSLIEAEARKYICILNRRWELTFCKSIGLANMS